MNEVVVTEADASDNEYLASNIIGKKVWVVSNGRVFPNIFQMHPTSHLHEGTTAYLRDTFVGT